LLALGVIIFSSATALAVNRQGGVGRFAPPELKKQEGLINQAFLSIRDPAGRTHIFFNQLRINKLGYNKFSARPNYALQLSFNDFG